MRLIKVGCRTPSVTGKDVVLNTFLSATFSCISTLVFDIPSLARWARESQQILVCVFLIYYFFEWQANDFRDRIMRSFSILVAATSALVVPIFAQDANTTASISPATTTVSSSVTAAPELFESEVSGAPWPTSRCFAQKLIRLTSGHSSDRCCRRQFHQYNTKWDHLKPVRFW